MRIRVIVYNETVRSSIEAPSKNQPSPNSRDSLRERRLRKDVRQDALRLIDPDRQSHNNRPRDWTQVCCVALAPNE
jgi:hypothetical protein